MRMVPKDHITQPGINCHSLVATPAGRQNSQPYWTNVISHNERRGGAEIRSGTLQQLSISYPCLALLTSSPPINMLFKLLLTSSEYKVSELIQFVLTSM